ncbi:MAG TPA: redoxin domain-containing protein [Dongiaceae bacterium]|nr:redoxin domain-containing protein [Dongiaceae bacterium]
MTLKPPGFTTRAWLLAGILLLAGLTWFTWHRQINRSLEVNLLLRSASPREELFEELSTQTADPTEFLERCWATGKVPHRQLVAAFLSRTATQNPSWFAGAQKFLLQGAADPDLSVRQLALATLQSRAAPDLFDSARAQLTDADPAVRQLGLDYLRRLEARRAVPLAMALLDDPDLLLAASAEVALMNWTGQDFGVRTHLAVPSKQGGHQLEPARVDKIRHGIERRKEWWQIHAKEFSAAPISSSQMDRGVVASPPVEDFTLPDLEGRRVRLDEFRGKTVLLNFWATWCPACLAEIPELIALHEKLGDRVAILGVALDGLPDEDGHQPGEPMEGRAHAEPRSRKAVRDKVARAVKALGINYPVLLDPEAAVGGRFNGGELPTTVIIDPQGRLRRRFIGERSLRVFEAMTAEAAKPLPQPAPLR